MPSTHDHSAGAPATARRRSAPPEIRGDDDALADLIAQSEAAAARLLASTDWVAHDALVAQLAEESGRAATLLLAAHHETLTVGTVPVVQPHEGDDLR